MAHSRKNDMTLHQNWSLVTSGDLNIDLSEKWLKHFRLYSFRAIERFFPCLSIPISFESSRVVILPHPHPLTRAKMAETATRARVKMMCKTLGLGFVDMWDDFHKNNMYYLRDAFHLSDEGQEC